MLLHFASEVTAPLLCWLACFVSSVSHVDTILTRVVRVYWQQLLLDACQCDAKLCSIRQGLPYHQCCRSTLGSAVTSSQPLLCRRALMKNTRSIAYGACMEPVGSLQQQQQLQCCVVHVHGKECRQIATCMHSRAVQDTCENYIRACHCKVSHSPRATSHIPVC
jgi:hypothetical protein